MNTDALDLSADKKMPYLAECFAKLGSEIRVGNRD